MDLNAIFKAMHTIYSTDPVQAVRGQAFINLLHEGISADLDAQLSNQAKRRKVSVVKEAKIYGSHKSKDVDVSVVDPQNGPLVMIGVRSQMSSVGKNALTYYEGIIGECISLQDRFPMAVFGYVYLMPVRPIKVGKESESIDHLRYARMYDAITGRSGQLYRDIRGIFDEFAYMVVDFDTSPPKLREELLGTPEHDLSIETFVERIIRTFKQRHIFVDVFN